MTFYERLVVGRTRSNAYIIVDGDNVGVIDPGDESNFIIGEIKSKSPQPNVSILLTHGHIDQIRSVPNIVEAFPRASVYAGRAENLFLYNSAANLSRHTRAVVTFTEISQNIKNVITGDLVSVGKYEFRVIETPGHTPGSLMYVCDPEGVSFCGDTILREGIAGTNLPFGDETRLFASIRDRVLTLPANIKLLPAHGEETTLAHEKEKNPYILSMKVDMGE
jgi:glyoxylase-like metal-dependent hydrolase (beta-lactamase superfamily II)